LVAQGRKTTVLEVINAGLGKIRDAQLDDPAARVELMHTLADVYNNLGASQQAADLVDEAYQYSLLNLGSNHRLTWNTLNLLAGANIRLGNFDAAEDQYNKCLDTVESISGPGKGKAKATALNGMAILYLRTGRYEKATQTSEDAVALARQHSGPLDESTVIFENTLSDIYNNSGKPAKAIRLLLEARPRAEAALGGLHRDVIGMTLNLAVAYYQQGKLDQATPLLEDVRERNLKVFGPDHPETVKDSANLGTLYADTGRLEEAEMLILETITKQAKLTSAQHPMTLRYRSTLAFVYLQQQKYTEAIILCDELLPLMHSINGPNHWHTVETRQYRAMSVYESGATKQGSIDLIAVFTDMRAIFGLESGHTKQLADYLREKGIELP